MKTCENTNSQKIQRVHFFRKAKDTLKKLKKNTHRTLLNLEKKLKMIDTRVTFKSYRRKYLFTDFEVLFFIFLFFSFCVFLVALYWLYGLSMIIKYMFFLFLMPVFILVFFDIKARIANRKKSKMIMRRKLQKSEKLKNILLMEKNEDESIVSNYIPLEKVELSKRDYVDIKYELKLLALEHKADAVIGLQIEDSIVSGYLAKLKREV
jgi:ABC-type multidrug transport system fused ATPase/permease subunit